MFDLFNSTSPQLQPCPDNLAEAVAQIERAELVGEQQQTLRTNVLQFCQRNHNALHRTCLDGHLTASSLIVNAQRSEVLVIRHTKLRRWLQPGGHADGNGNLQRVAWDEATEETGLPDLSIAAPAIDIDIHAIPARGIEPEHLHLDLRFLLLAPSAASVEINHESTDFAWVTPDDALVADEPDLQRAIGRALDVVATLQGSGDSKS